MFVTVDERDARPLYQQLVDEIKTLIARGELAEGRFAARSTGSLDLGVNLNTVAFAYRRLQQEGADMREAWVWCGRHLPNAQREA